MALEAKGACEESSFAGSALHPAHSCRASTESLKHSLLSLCLALHSNGCAILSIPIGSISSSKGSF